MVTKKIWLLCRHCNKGEEIKDEISDAFYAYFINFGYLQELAECLSVYLVGFDEERFWVSGMTGVVR